MALAPTLEEFHTKSITVGFVDIDKIKDYSLHYLIKEKEVQVGIVDNIEGKQLLFESYTLKNPSAKLKAENLEDIILEHHLLQAGFWKNVTVSFSNQYTTLVPKALYDNEYKQEYLKLSSLAPNGEQLELASYKQPSMDAINVFAYVSGFEALIRTYYSNTEVVLVHETASFLESCLRESEGNKSVFLNVDEKSFMLCVVDNSQLIYLNQFEYKTPEDFAYFALAVLKELNIDLEHDIVTVWGEIVHDSPIYNLLYKYIRHVEFGKRPSFLSFSFHFDEIIDHRYFTLFSQNLCK